MKPGGCALLIVTAGAAGTLAGCAAAPPVPVVPAVSSVVPPDLIGASVMGLRTSFGPPALQRVDGPAQVWLYDSRLCRLSVVLYPGPDGAPLVTAAMPMPATISRSRCLASLEHGAAS